MNKRTREWLFPVTAASVLLAMTGVGHAHASQVQQNSQNSNKSITSKPIQQNQPSNIKTSSSNGQLNEKGQVDQNSGNNSNLLSIRNVKNLTSTDSGNSNEEYAMAGQGEPGHTSESNQDKQRVEQYYLQDINQWSLTNWQKIELTRDAQDVLKDYQTHRDNTVVGPDPLWSDWIKDVVKRSDYKIGAYNNKDLVNKYLQDQGGLMPKAALKYMEIADTLSRKDMDKLTQEMYQLADRASKIDSGMATGGSVEFAIPGGASFHYCTVTSDGEVRGALEDPYVPFDLQAQILLREDLMGYNMKPASTNSWAPAARPTPNPGRWYPNDRARELDQDQDRADKALESVINKVGTYDINMRFTEDVGPDGMLENIEPYWAYDGKPIPSRFEDPNSEGPDDFNDDGNFDPGAYPRTPETYEDLLQTCEDAERDPKIPIDFRAKIHQIADQDLKPFWDYKVSAVESSLRGMITQLLQSNYGKSIPGVSLQTDLPESNAYENRGDWDWTNKYSYWYLVSGMPGSYQSEDSICQHILADTKIPSDFRQKFADLYHYWTRERVQQTPKMCLDSSIPYNTFAVSIVPNNLRAGHTASLQQIIGTKAYDQFKGIKPNSNNNKKQTSGSASNNPAKSNASSSASRPSSSAVLPIINNSAGPSPYDQKSNIPDITPHLHWNWGKNSLNPTSMSFISNYPSNSTSSASKQPQSYAQSSFVFSSKSSSTSNRSANTPTEVSSSQSRNSMNQSSSMPIYSNANTEVQSSSASHSDREYNGSVISDNYKSQNEESPSSLKIDGTNTSVNQYLPEAAPFGMQASNSSTNNGQSSQSPIPLNRQELPATGEHAAAYLMLGLILISFGVIIDRRRRTV